MITPNTGVHMSLRFCQAMCVCVCVCVCVSVCVCARASHRSNEEFGVDSSEQCGGLSAPQPRCPVAFVSGTLLPSPDPFLRHARSMLSGLTYTDRLTSVPLSP